MKKEKDDEQNKRKQAKLNILLSPPAIQSTSKHWPQMLESILSLVDICDQFVIAGAKT